MSIPLEIGLRYHARPVGPKEHMAGGTARAADDTTLAAQARKGSVEAFEELIRRYRNDVFGVTYHYVGDREEAWDLAQEVFVKAYKGIGRFRGDASFKTWILRIAANRCKDFFKKRRLKTVGMDDEYGDRAPAPAHTSPQARLEQSELREALQQALDTLSENHRAVIVLREYEGLSYEEMATALDCSLGTVMSRLHHARKNMQKALIALGAVEAKS